MRTLFMHVGWILSTQEYVQAHFLIFSTIFRRGRSKFQHSQEAHHRYLSEEEHDPIYRQLIEFYSLVFQCIQIIRLKDYRVCPSKSDLLLSYRVMRSGLGQTDPHTGFLEARVQASNKKQVYGLVLSNLRYVYQLYFRLYCHRHG